MNNNLEINNATVAKLARTASRALYQTIRGRSNDWTMVTRQRMMVRWMGDRGVNTNFVARSCCAFIDGSSESSDRTRESWIALMLCRKGRRRHCPSFPDGKTETPPVPFNDSNLKSRALEGKMRRYNAQGTRASPEGMLDSASSA